MQHCTFFYYYSDISFDLRFSKTGCITHENGYRYHRNTKENNTLLTMVLELNNTRYVIYNLSILAKKKNSVSSLFHAITFSPEI